MRAPRTSPPCGTGWTAAGIAYEHDPRLVRGLDYYTRTAFEFVSGALPQAQARRSAAAGATTDSPRCSAGRRRPASASGWAWTGCCSRWRTRARRPRRAGARVLRRGDRRDRRAAGGRLARADLRDAGVPADDARRGAPAEGAAEDGRPRRRRRSSRSSATQELAAGAVTLRRLVDGVQKTVPAAMWCHGSPASTDGRTDRDRDQHHAHRDAHARLRRAARGPRRRGCRPLRLGRAPRATTAA